MTSQILWWIEIGAEAFVLARSSNAKLYGKYPRFYFYLSVVLVLELLRFSVHSLYPSVYGPFYWYTQFLAVTVGYAVIVEIYNQSLKNSPGVAHVARTAVFGLLAAVILKVTAGAALSSTWSPAVTTAELERDLRAVQTLLLVVIIGLLAYYKVPIGRNLKGITLGYSFYVGATVMSLAFGSLPGYALRQGWRLVQLVAYLVALLIWGSTLWSYQPDPEPETESEIERDYTFIVEQTRKALSRARSFLKADSEL